MPTYDSHDHSGHPRNVQRKRADERRKAKQLVEELRDELALTVVPDRDSATEDRKRELIRRANQLLGDDSDFRLP